MMSGPLPQNSSAGATGQKKAPFKFLKRNSRREPSALNRLNQKLNDRQIANPSASTSFASGQRSQPQPASDNLSEQYQRPVGQSIQLRQDFEGRPYREGAREGEISASRFGTGSSINSGARRELIGSADHSSFMERSTVTIAMSEEAVRMKQLCVADELKEFEEIEMQLENMPSLISSSVDLRKATDSRHSNDDSQSNDSEARRGLRNNKHNIDLGATSVSAHSVPHQPAELYHQSTHNSRNPHLDSVYETEKGTRRKMDLRYPFESSQGSIGRGFGPWDSTGEVGYTSMAPPPPPPPPPPISSDSDALLRSLPALPAERLSRTGGGLRDMSDASENPPHLLADDPLDATGQLQFTSEFDSWSSSVHPVSSSSKRAENNYNGDLNLTEEDCTPLQGTITDTLPAPINHHGGTPIQGSNSENSNNNNHRRHNNDTSATNNNSGYTFPTERIVGSEHAGSRKLSGATLKRLSQRMAEGNNNSSNNNSNNNSNSNSNNTDNNTTEDNNNRSTIPSDIKSSSNHGSRPAQDELVGGTAQRPQSSFSHPYARASTVGKWDHEYGEQLQKSTSSQRDGSQSVQSDSRQEGGSLQYLQFSKPPPIHRNREEAHEVSSSDNECGGELPAVEDYFINDGSSVSISEAGAYHHQLGGSAAFHDGISHADADGGGDAHGGVGTSRDSFSVNSVLESFVGSGDAHRRGNMTMTMATTTGASSSRMRGNAAQPSSDGMNNRLSRTGSFRPENGRSFDGNKVNRGSKSDSNSASSTAGGNSAARSSSTGRLRASSGVVGTAGRERDQNGMGRGSPSAGNEGILLVRPKSSLSQSSQGSASRALTPSQGRRSTGGAVAGGGGGPLYDRNGRRISSAAAGQKSIGGREAGGGEGENERDYGEELVKKMKQLEAELETYRSENVTLKKLRKQQETALAEVLQKKEEVGKWAEEERQKTQQWCEEQKLSAAKERRTAAKLASESRLKASTGAVPIRKEKAEMEALRATVEKMKLDHETATKKFKTNENRLYSMLRDHTQRIEDLQAQTVAMEEENLALFEIVNKAGLKVPRELRRSLQRNLSVNNVNSVNSVGKAVQQGQRKRDTPRFAATTGAVGSVGVAAVRRVGGTGGGSSSTGKRVELNAGGAGARGVGGKSGEGLMESYVEEAFDAEQVMVHSSYHTAVGDRLDSGNAQLDDGDGDHDDHAYRDDDCIDNEDKYDYEDELERDREEEEDGEKGRGAGRTAAVDDGYEKYAASKAATFAASSGMQLVPKLDSNSKSFDFGATERGVAMSEKAAAVASSPSSHSLCVSARGSGTWQRGSTQSTRSSRYSRSGSNSLDGSHIDDNENEDSELIEAAAHRIGVSSGGIMYGGDGRKRGDVLGVAERGDIQRGGPGAFSTAGTGVTQEVLLGSTAPVSGIDAARAGRVSRPSASRLSDAKMNDFPAQDHPVLSGTTPFPAASHASSSCGAQQNKREERLSDGRTIVTYKNGTVKEVSTDGAVSCVRFQNGDTKTTDTTRQVVIYYYALADTTHTTYTEDGLEVYEFPNKQIERHFPDGLKEIIFPDATRKVIGTDNTQITFFPDGVVLKEHADGRSEVVGGSGSNV